MVDNVRLRVLGEMFGRSPSQRSRFLPGFYYGKNVAVWPNGLAFEQPIHREWEKGCDEGGSGGGMRGEREGEKRLGRLVVEQCRKDEQKV